MSTPPPLSGEMARIVTPPLTAEAVLIDHLRRIAAAGHAFYRRDIKQAIARLPDRQGEAMHWYWLEGVTNRAEIARRMSISATSVRDLLDSGLLGLLGILAAKFPDVEMVNAKPVNANERQST